MIGVHPDIERILITETEIQSKVSRLAEQISEDYAANGQLVVVGILKGSFIFLADLTRRLSVPHRVDFLALSSYGQTTTTTGAVRIIMDLRVNIEGRHVLIVEDIIDSGYTLHYLLELLRTRNPASLRSCVLLSKPDRRKVDVTVDYLGFEIPDVWVVGYGLDFAELHRTLPYIGALRPEVYQ
ncbi:MAG: hypoxanthine phosphoribosyltransferase [Chloroflexota bacterium]